MNTRPVEDRFWEKVNKDGPNGCWLWTASGKPHGYGHIWLNGRYELSHRLAYMWMVGPIPVGMHLDHLCRTPGCVNPEHLEVVTPRENTLRGVGPSAYNAYKSVCMRGHPFNEANTRWYKGKRHCRPCSNFLVKRWKAARKAALKAEAA